MVLFLRGIVVIICFGFVGRWGGEEFSLRGVLEVLVVVFVGGVVWGSSR